MQFLNKEVFEEARNSSYLRQGVAILFISTMESDPWGGSEELWSLVAERLVEDGYTVSASIKEWPEMAPRVRRTHDKRDYYQNAAEVILADPRCASDIEIASQYVQRGDQ